jgi:ketosteroid isomerase-like protein
MTAGGADGGEVIDRLFAALAQGDLAAAAACCTPDVRVWHSFDGVAHDLAGIMAEWQGLVAGFPERAFVDVRRQPTPQGFVQQHVMLVRTASGVRKAWPLCIVVRIADGLIARLDEYIDRAGTFDPPADGEVRAPGL